MSLFHPIPKEMLGREFTHYGWMMFAPIYIGGFEDEGEPHIAVRNWCPEWVLDFAEALNRAWFEIIWAMGSDAEYGAAFVVGGPIKE